MNKYRYQGDITVVVPGVGKVDPGQTVRTMKDIDNANFVLIKIKQPVLKRSKS